MIFCEAILLLQCYVVLFKRISIWVFICPFEYPLWSLSEFKHLSAKELLILLFKIVESQASTFLSIPWEILFFSEIHCKFKTSFLFLSVMMENQSSQTEVLLWRLYS